MDEDVLTASQTTPSSGPVSSASTTDDSTPDNSIIISQSPDLALSRRSSKRRSRTNVRTGCRTCKQRRVKCDETKPFCLKCTNFSRTCAGYEANIEPITKYGTKYRDDKLLIPRRTNSNTPIFMTPSLGLEDFGSAAEHAYFRLFCEKTSTILAGDLDGPLWNRIILQACDAEPSLRHAVVALGAMDKTDEAQRLRYRSGTLAVAIADADAHHTVALQQYSKSVVGMRKAIADGKMDIRGVLIGCLLAVCFECFHGNTGSAISLAKSGLHLINDASPNAWNSLRDSRDGVSSTLEDEIIVAFNRLDINTVSFILGGPIRVRQESLITPMHVLSRIPAQFDDFDTARQCMELLFRVAIHWVTYQSEPPSEDDVPKWADYDYENDTRKTVIMWTDHQRVIPTWDQFLTFMHRWWQSVQHLFVWARSPEGHKHLNIAIALELRFRTAYFAFSNCRGVQVQHDKDLLDAEVLLDRAESLHARRKAQRPVIEAAFVFDGPFIGALHVVTQRTRDPAVRRRAIALLESKPRREGLWDSSMIARLASLSLDIEEKQQRNGVIPVHARIQASRCIFDLQERKGLLQFRRRKLNEAEGYVHDAIEFDW